MLKRLLPTRFPIEMAIKEDDGNVIVERPTDMKQHRAYHGTTRALINNMVIGVSKGFEKVLTIEGVGYRAEMEGQTLVMSGDTRHGWYWKEVVLKNPDRLIAGREYASDKNIILDSEARVELIPQGGNVRAENNKLIFEDCDSLVILMAAAPSASHTPTIPR